jgi:hypothetical protein
LAGFLAVQLTYNHLQENGFKLAVSLKFKIGWNVCQDGIVQLGLSGGFYRLWLAR